MLVLRIVAIMVSVFVMVVRTVNVKAYINIIFVAVIVIELTSVVILVMNTVEVKSFV